MTGEPTDDNEDRIVPLTRRQALAGIGAGLLTGAGAASSIAQTDPLTERQAQWTARRKRRASATTTDATVEGISTMFDEVLPDASVGDWELGDVTDDAVKRTVENTVGDRAVPLDTVDLTSQLYYLGAQWDEYSNPTPSTGDDGAWKHTFVLSTIGAAQRLDPEATWGREDAPVEYDADKLQFRANPAIKLQPGLRVMATADEEYDEPRNPFNGQSTNVGEDLPDLNDEPDQGEQHVAVSARRDRDLFGFAGPGALRERVDESAAMRDLLNQMATSPTDATADYGLIRRSAFEAAQRRKKVKAVGRILSGMSGIAGAVGGKRGEAASSYFGNAAEPFADGEFDATELAALEGGSMFPSTLEKLNETIETLVSVADDLAELVDDAAYDPSRREFFHGFQQFLGTAGPYSLGYVMFDVYVAPGKTGYVDVTAANRLADEEHPQVTDTYDDYPVVAHTWRLGFEARPAKPAYDAPLPPNPELEELGPRDLYNARIVGSEFSVSDPSGDPEDSYPLGHIDERERQPRPGPTIVPAIETADGAPQRVEPGDRPTFSAHDTTYAQGPVDEYRWSIHQLATLEDGQEDRDERSAYLEQSSGSATFSPEIEAPEATDSGVQRVKLTAISGDVSATTHREFPVGEPPSPDATVSVTPAEPVLGDQLLFELDADLPGQPVERFWEVTDHPAELDDAPDAAVQGTGAEFPFDPPSVGEYAVEVYARDDLGAEVSETVAVEVTGEFGVDVEAPAAVAPGDEVDVQAVVTGDVEVDAYEWQLFGETRSGREASATFERDDDPTITVTAISADETTATGSAEPEVEVVPTYSADVLEGASSGDLGFHVYRDGSRVVVRIRGTGDGHYYRFDVTSSAGTLSNVRKASWNDIETIDSSNDDRLSGSGRVASGYDQFSFATDAAVLTFDLEFSGAVSGKPSPTEVETQPRPDRVHLGGDGTTPEAIPFRVDLDVADSAGPIDGFEPTDPDDDGRYEDVNGDGSVTNTDVTTFFSNQHVPEWNDRTDLFDFDGDGDVGQSDVIELFEYLTS